MLCHGGRRDALFILIRSGGQHGSVLKAQIDKASNGRDRRDMMLGEFLQRSSVEIRLLTFGRWDRDAGTRTASGVQGLQTQMALYTKHLVGDRH